MRRPSSRPRWKVFASTHTWVTSDRKSTRLNSSHVEISYAVFCLKQYRDPRDLHSFPTRRSSDLDYAAKGTRVELDGMEKVEDRDTYKLKLTFKSGDVTHVWVDAKTFLEAKVEGLRIHPYVGYVRSEEHTSELQSRRDLVCRLLLETIPRPPRSTLFPYTTLFRSRLRGQGHAGRIGRYGKSRGPRYVQAQANLQERRRNPRMGGCEDLPRGQGGRSSHPPIRGLRQIGRAHV